MPPLQQPQQQQVLPTSGQAGQPFGQAQGQGFDMNLLLQLLLPLLQGQGIPGVQPGQAQGQPFSLGGIQAGSLAPPPAPSVSSGQGGPGAYGPEVGTGATPEQTYNMAEISSAVSGATGKGGSFDASKSMSLLGGGGGKGGQGQQKSNPAYSAPIYETFLRR